MMKQRIALLNKGIYANPTMHKSGAPSEIVADKIQHLLMSYGFVLLEEAYNELIKATAEHLNIVAKELAVTLQTLYGDPKAKDLTAIVAEGHEVGTSAQSFYRKVWNPETSDISDDAFYEIYEHRTFKSLKLYDQESFMGIFTKLVSVGIALTPQDMEIVTWFCNEYDEEYLGGYLPKTIPFKETLCVLAAHGLNVPVKSPDDVLRIASYMSFGDTDLVVPPRRIQASTWKKGSKPNPEYEKKKFKKFKRSERKHLLKLLNRVADPRDMVQRRNRWIVLGEILHPGDYATVYPKAFNAFYRLRNEKVRSWESEVDEAFEHSFKAGLVKLGERPGVLARRLDSLLRDANAEDTDDIIEAFYATGEKVSSKVLWELYAHFESRLKPTIGRTIKVKGSRTATKLPDLPALRPEIVETIQENIFAVLSKKYASLDSLGNVFIDARLRDIPIPRDMRSLSESVVTVTRGARIPLPVETKVLRSYVHWKTATDIDLSMTFCTFKKGFEKVEYDYDTRFGVICDFGTTNPCPGTSHSGDVIPKYDGNWAEYVDVHMDKIPYRYGLLTVHNYSGGPLSAVNPIVGFMGLAAVKPGTTRWYPESVENSFNIKSAAGTVVVILVDFDTKEYMVIDEDANSIPVALRSNIDEYVNSLAAPPAVSVYDILEMHAKARGEIVDNPADADTVFKFDDFSTDYVKTGQYMLGE